MSTRKSWNCCAVMVQKPTIPSAVGTMEGSSRLRRPRAWSSPSTLADTAPNEPIAITMASKSDTSMVSPAPVRRAARTAAAAATAA